MLFQKILKLQQNGEFIFFLFMMPLELPMLLTTPLLDIMPTHLSYYMRKLALEVCKNDGSMYLLAIFCVGVHNINLLNPF